MRPVNRLPPEILSHIALYLIGSDEDDAISVVPLTHVCRYWRESIISTPEIWALVSGKNEDMTTVCLGRAKAAPLKITLYMPLGSSFTDIFASYLQNTRTLVIHSISTIEEFMSVFPDFPRSMPTLRSLELAAIPPQDTWDPTIDPFEPFPPPLERLQLTGVPLYASLLKLGTLTEFTFSDREFPGLDTLLDFLEGNCSLERVTLDSYSAFLLGWERKIAMKQLRYLSISCSDEEDAQALISSIPLQRGASLRIHLRGWHRTLIDFLPDVSATHLSNPPSPTFFQLGHGPLTKHITLDGPSGKLSFYGISLLEASFADLAVLPLSNVREVRLHYRKETTTTSLEPPVFYPSYFPALETLTVDCNVDVLGALSVLLSNSPPSPSLKTLGFLNCNISEDFMEGLTRFASGRRNIPTSTWLHRVQFAHGDGVFPSAASIRRLRKYVQVVEVRMEDDFSMDLTSMTLTPSPYY